MAESISVTDVLQAVIAVEEVVVDVTLLVGIPQVDRFLEVLGTLSERRGVRRTVHCAQVTGIVEQRGICGCAVSGARLCPESRGIGIGGGNVLARVDTRVTNLRTEIADLLQPVLRLRSALGVDLVSLVVSLDGHGGSLFQHPVGLRPGNDLAVLDVGDEIGVLPRFVGNVEKRHLLGGRRFAHGQLQHRGVHVDEEALRRFHGSLVQCFATVDPRGGLGVLLRIGDVGVALLDLGEEPALVDFLRLHGRDSHEQRRESRQKCFLHNKI